MPPGPAWGRSACFASAVMLLGLLWAVPAMTQQRSSPDQALAACLQASDPTVKVAGCEALLSVATLPPDVRVVALAQLAVGHSRLNRPDLAIPPIERAIGLSPQTGALYRLQGYVYRQARNVPAALIAYERAWALGDRHVTVIQGLTDLYQITGRADDALTIFEQRMTEAPNDGALFAFRALFLYRAGDRDRSLADAGTALRLDPENALAYQILGNWHLADFAYEAALADFNRSLQYEPGNLNTLINRAQMHAALGEHEAAIADYDRVLARTPDSGMVLMLRGDTHHGMGTIEGAVRDWSRAMRLGGPEAVRHFQVRATLAGHYDGPLDGQFHDGMPMAVAECAFDPDCTQPLPDRYCEMVDIRPCRLPFGIPIR